MQAETVNAGIKHKANNLFIGCPFLLGSSEPFSEKETHEVRPFRQSTQNFLERIRALTLP